MSDSIPQEVIKTSDKTARFYIFLLALAFVLGGKQYLLDDSIQDLENSITELKEIAWSNALDITRLTRGQEEFLRRLDEQTD